MSMVLNRPIERFHIIETQQVFSFKPADIVEQLDLLRPIYRGSTHYGHFAKSDLPWACKQARALPQIHKLNNLTEL